MKQVIHERIMWIKSFLVTLLFFEPSNRRNIPWVLNRMKPLGPDSSQGPALWVHKDHRD